MSNGQVSQSEWDADYAATEADIKRLAAIVENLDLFITQAGEEDRRRFRVDLYKWQGILSEAQRLKTQMRDFAREKGLKLPDPPAAPDSSIPQPLAELAEARERIRELTTAVNRLLEIARLAQFYAPGELGEFPEKMAADIEYAESTLKGESQP